LEVFVVAGVCGRDAVSWNTCDKGQEDRHGLGRRFGRTLWRQDQGAQIRRSSVTHDASLTISRFSSRWQRDRRWSQTVTTSKIWSFLNHGRPRAEVVANCDQLGK